MTEGFWRTPVQRSLSPAEYLLLDCIGFTERHRSRLAAIGLPVILSNALMAKAVGELFSGWGGN